MKREQMGTKPSYAELKRKLQEAENILDTLRNHKVDAVIGTSQIAMMRLREVEDELQEQIKISDNRLREIESIYENVPIGLGILDRDLVFVRVNNHLAKMHGIPAEEHLNQSIEDLLPGLLRPAEELQRVIESGEPQMNVELAGETPDRPGEERHWREHRLPLFNKQDQVIGINMVVEEITDRKRYEQNLKQLNAILEERVEQRTQSLLSYQGQLRSLASQLSKAEEQERHRLAAELHDNLGQMLAVSKMKIDLLPKEELPEKVAEDVKEIKEGINDAIVYTRELMSELKPPPSLDKEDVRETIQWLAKKMERQGLEVLVEDDGHPKLTSEEVRNTLLQGVRELLFNVVKHTDERKAWVRMTRVEDQVKIVVEDKGEGFNLDDLSNGMSKEGGFGLFNIRERMNQLNCHIEVDSVVGRGTEVTLKAPLKEAIGSEETGAGVTEDQNGTSAEGKMDREVKVLLADDHQMIRRGLKKIVDAEEDMRVVAEASNGREAVEMARDTSPDIVIMDVNMPEMNGIEATEKIRSQMPEIRVVGLSLHDHKKVIDSMRTAGASAYLTKNQAFETLCATIRSEARVTK